MDRKALARATESSDAPTPGYLYIDIAKSVSISPKVCQDTIQYLLKRLQNKNHNIKHKTLKVISKVVDHPQYGGHQFKQSISTNPEFIAAIRDASTFRGPPDPLRGMTIYEQVHEAAKEALASIYSDSGPSNNGGVGGGGMNSGGGGFGGGIGGGGGMAPGMSTSYGNPISSNGYNNHGAMGSSTGGMSMGGTTRMEGIGNPNFSDPRLASQSNGEGGVRGSLRNMTVSQVIGNVQETVVNMVKDPLARNVQNMSSTNGGGIGTTKHSSELPGYGRPSLGSPPGRSQLSAATNGQWTMASNRGPNAIQPPGSMGGGYDPQRDAYQREKEMSYGGSSNRPQPLPNHNHFAPVNGSVFGSWGKSAVGGGGVGGGHHTTMQSSQYHHHNPVPSYTSGSGGTAVSDGSYERNLIAELCPPGGMKAEPPIDKMEQFERNVSRLNSDLVCPVLLDQLEDGTPWIVKAKTLVVIYRTIRATSHLNPNPYADFFHACIEEIQPLANHPRTAIRDPARNVLNELGVEIVAQQDGNVEEETSGVVATTRSTTVVSSVPPSSSSTTQNAVVDLLDFSAGISDDQNVPPPPPETQPPPPPPATVDNSTTNGTTMSSLFGGLTVQDNRSSTKVNGSTTTASSTNLLDDGNVLQETLGDVSNQNTASSQDPLSLGGGGGMKSGFGFLNGGTMNAAAPSTTTTTTTTTEPRDPPTSSHTPPSNNTTNSQDKFDPLLSLDWNSSSNTTSGQQHNGGNHYYNMMQQHHHQQPMMMSSIPTPVMSPPKPGLGFNLNNSSELMTGNAAGMMGSYNTMNSPTRNGSLIRTMGNNGMGIQQQTILVQSPKHHHQNIGTSTTGGGGANSFSFYMNEMAEKKKQQDQSFDFIKDAMKTKK